MSGMFALQTQPETQTVAARSSCNGLRQKPIEGVSMVYAFAHAKAVSKRPTQYFEMMDKR